MSLPNAFVTLLTTPSYLPGALVLLHSILELHPEPRQFKTVCLVTPETVDARTIGEVRKAGFDLVIGVEPIGSGVQGEEGLRLMGRPDLNLALTKLHLFRLHTLFSTLIYLDADVLPLRPLSHLFTTTAPHVLSAAPDTGWPDCFNSGVMVIRPNEKDWEGLRRLLKNGEGEDGIYVEGQEDGGALYGNGSFDGADQGLLNEYFSEEGGGGQWNRLSFLYNVTPTAAYQYEPAYRRYGSKVNAVHFIGPNKPWSSLSSRPAGMSLPKGKEAKFDYPSLIDRWYEVYDRTVRPATAHHPDLAKRFKVPEHVAVWNSSNTIPHQPADRLDLAQLKAAVGIGMTAMTPGQYTSLPLDGRVDLIMPKPQVKEPSPPKSPTIAGGDTPQVYTAPLPQTLHQQTTQPAVWDAQRYAPPVGGQPEMSVPMNTVYNAAWDEPASQQSTFYSSPEKHRPEPQYPHIPDNVKKDTWYSHFTGTTPDRSHIQPVFPWEQPGQRRPDRVFPQDSAPLAYKQAEPTKEVESVPLSNAASARQPSPPPVSAPPPRSMSEAMASYTNAWDSHPQIQRYVDRVTGRPPRLGLGELPRGTDLSSLKSVPNTPRYETIPLRTRTRSGDRRSEASGDGDDEDDGNSTESNNDSPALGNSNRLEQVTYPYPYNARYRDRHAQTDKMPVADAKVQKNAGESSSPALKTVPLSRESSTPAKGGSRKSSNNTQAVSSSSETTPRAPNVVTPQSTSEHSTPTGGVSNRIPFPVNPSTTRRMSNNSNGSGNGSAPQSRRTSGMTDSGVPIAGQKPTRQFLASTDPDRMKKDTQEVLSRFMGQDGGMAS